MPKPKKNLANRKPFSQFLDTWKVPKNPNYNRLKHNRANSTRAKIFDSSLI